MPLPKPKGDETKDQFIERCMGDETMRSEFPDEDQRYAICHAQWERPKDNAADHEIESHRFVTLKSSVGGVRRETVGGREYLVVPTVAIVQGVLNGELALAEEFGAQVAAWNGRPVVYRHPYYRGVPISANSSPQVAAAYQIGTIYNAQLDGDRLKAEMWIDLEKVRNMSEEVQARVRAMERGEPVEVSTGYFAVLERSSGTYNGRPYYAIQRRIVPDHLAVLPADEIGACSWADGCGAPRVAHRRNHETKGGEMMSGPGRVKAVLMSAMRALGLTTNEMSHADIRDALYRALTNALPKDTYVFVRDVYDDYVVYEVGDLTGNERILKRSYTIDQNGNVILGDDETEVRPETNYVEVTPPEDQQSQQTAVTNRQITKSSEGAAVSGTVIVNSCGCNKRSAVNNEKKEVENVRKQELINALIANTATKWTEADRAVLEQLDETVLEKMLPVNQTEPAPAVNEAKTPEDVIANISDPQLRAVFDRLIRQARERRNQMISELTANSRCRFSKERLEAMSDDDLEALYESLKPEDYSGRPAPRLAANAADDDRIPPPPAVLLAKSQ